MMCFKSKHFCYCVVFVLIVSVFQVICNGTVQDRHYWYNAAREILERRTSKNRFSSENPIKNVVIFIGDGMGLSTVTAARILKGQRNGNTGEEEQLIWDTFPATAFSKTYNADAQIGESSACATALMCGVKANYETLGVDSSVKFGQCAGSHQGRVPSLISWAHEYGKQSGIVTTTRITHATPAALYAHSPSRFWEDDSKIDVASRSKCKDIARQLIEDEPGYSIKVILGGGRRHFTSMATLDPTPPHKEGKRLDGRNLIDEWLRNKNKNKFNATYVTNSEQLRAVDPSKTDYLFGLFSHSHLNFDLDRDSSSKGEPSLSEMTEKALQMLQPSQNGYFLMVEGGRIDHGHHFNNAFRALDETLSMEKAVTSTLQIVNLTETLVVVTADHSHVMVFGGYSTPRGNSVFGYDRIVSDVDEKAYTTLLYSNGPGGIKFKKRDLKEYSIKHEDAIQRAAVPRTWATHAGEDVPVYAIGHMASELFGGTIDQTFIPLAIAYGSCMGPFGHKCKDIKLTLRKNNLSSIGIIDNMKPSNMTGVKQKSVLLKHYLQRKTTNKAGKIFKNHIAFPKFILIMCFLFLSHK